MANILLLEDYASLQRVYKTILQAAGHKVTVAVNGKEGLSFAAEQNFDLILVDILMPVMGGIEFLETYNLKAHDGVKVIALTNILDGDVVKKVMKLGASNYIVKADTEPREVIRIINDTLSDTSKPTKISLFNR